MLDDLFRNEFKLSKKLIHDYNQSRLDSNKHLPICLAPSKSLRFLPDGNITVCCHNNSWSLGVFPQTSIIEAWNSVARAVIKKKISNADLSLGCYECLPSFINRNFDSANPKLYENYEVNNKFPAILDFKIATECNLECIMCSEYSSSSIRKKCLPKTSREFEYGDEFVEQVAEIIPFLKETRFSGGEPFLNNIYFTLWDLIVSRNPECKISIQTNGTILNQKIKTLLESGNFHINVSVDSANPNVYSLIRRNGDYNKLQENLKYFTNYCQKKGNRLGITCCSMRDNVFELPGVFKLANTLNAKLWYSDVHFPLVNALWLMNSEDLNESVAFLENQSFENCSPVFDHNFTVYCDMISRIKLFKDQASLRETKSKYVTPQRFKRDLKKVFKHKILTNSELWIRLEVIIGNLEANKMIDLAAEIKKYHKSDFVYSQLETMNDDQLKNNIACLSR
jgi:MoaA/NifB/PqqE/SkfB family radical SAM enzyme